jgi:hypothetical protein
MVASPQVPTPGVLLGKKSSNPHFHPRPLPSEWSGVLFTRMFVGTALLTLSLLTEGNKKTTSIQQTCLTSPIEARQGFPSLFMFFGGKLTKKWKKRAVLPKKVYLCGKIICYL